MKCHKCNLEDLGRETYCTVCGEPLNRSTDERLKSKNIEKNNRRILIGVVSILGIFVAIFITWMILKPNSLEVAKEAYQSSDLTTYQNVKNKLSQEQKNEFDNYIIEEAKVIVDLFKSDGLFYKEAIRRLEKIKLYVIETDEVDKLMNQVEILNGSREAYNEGKIWLKSKEWENAKECFETVSPIDSNYESARKYLESIQRW